MKTICVNGGFLAIPIYAGSHETELTYMISRLKMGILISFIAVIIWIILMIETKKCLKVVE